jgi:hypothetical protein
MACRQGGTLPQLHPGRLCCYGRCMGTHAGLCRVRSEVYVFRNDRVQQYRNLMSSPKYSPRMSQSAANTQQPKRADHSNLRSRDQYCWCQLTCSKQLAPADMYHQLCYSSRCSDATHWRTCMRITCSKGISDVSPARRCQLILKELRLTGVLTNIRLPVLPGWVPHKHRICKSSIVGRMISSTHHQ